MVQYLDFAHNLQEGIFIGFIDTTIEGPSLELVNVLNTNIHVFSAAKTFQEVIEMQSFITDDDGFIRSFSAFKKDVNPIYKQFNEEWQRTEFDTTIAQAQSNAQWQRIQEDKEIFPLLQYQTADDEKVRPVHAAWDNIVRPVDDPWWDDHNPPNGWNCRCLTISLEEGDEPISDLKGIPKHDDPLFQMNAGKDQIIFKVEGKDAHPYMLVEKRFEVHKANNFGLPLPEPIKPPTKPKRQTLKQKIKSEEAKILKQTKNKLEL